MAKEAVFSCGTSAPQFAEVCATSVTKISATVHLRAVSVDIHSGADAIPAAKDERRCRSGHLRSKREACTDANNKG